MRTVSKLMPSLSEISLYRNPWLRRSSTSCSRGERCSVGSAAGAASMAIYLAAGALGLPVFSPGGAPGIARFFGPTGGYLIAYPAAAWVAGALGAQQPMIFRRFLAACAGIVVIFTLSSALAPPAPAASLGSVNPKSAAVNV